MTINEITVVLSLMHILGDFYFQNEKIAEEKREKYKGVMKHSFEYLITSVAIACLFINADLIKLSVCLSFSHFIVDTLKYILTKKKNDESGIIFLWDQAIHILCIFILSYVAYGLNIKTHSVSSINQFLTVYGISKISLLNWTLVLLLLHKPTNIMIQILLNRYRPEEKSDEQKQDKRAGRIIGTLERLIMIIFLALNQYSAMGLVLTAKSIARYDRISKDEQFAEYYLLGTLLSTACAILCKVLILK